MGRFQICYPQSALSSFFTQWRCIHYNMFVLYNFYFPLKSGTERARSRCLWTMSGPGLKTLGPVLIAHHCSMLCVTSISSLSLQNQKRACLWSHHLIRQLCFPKKKVYIYYSEKMGDKVIPYWKHYCKPCIKYSLKHSCSSLSKMGNFFWKHKIFERREI